eukprot:SAG11_NODE_593_length_8303_cov_9.249756_1_plen_851_part_00
MSDRKAERESRVRTLLGDFYAVQEGEGAREGEGEVAVSSKAGGGDPFDLDGEAFDAERYMDEMMQSTRMKMMLEKTTNIRAEVKTLDNDMQMLVYENYTKFISATDTIKKMVVSIDDMGPEMGELANTISKISEGSTRINQSLSAHREKLDKLSDTRRLLSKLQFLKDLPNRLRKCMEVRDFAKAIKCFEATSGLLQRFKSLPDFKHLEGEIAEIMVQIEQALQQQLCDLDAEATDVTQSLQLLVKLGRDEDGCLDTFCAACVAKLEAQLQPPPAERGVAEEPPPLLELERSSTDGSARLRRFRDELGGYFVYYWLRYVMLFKLLFAVEVSADEGADAGGAAENVVRLRLLVPCKDLMAQYMELARQKMAALQDGEGGDDGDGDREAIAAGRQRVLVAQINRLLGCGAAASLVLPESEAALLEGCVSIGRDSVGAALDGQFGFGRAFALAEATTRQATMAVLGGGAIDGAGAQDDERRVDSAELLGLAANLVESWQRIFVGCVNGLSPLLELSSEYSAQLGVEEVRGLVQRKAVAWHGELCDFLHRFVEEGRGQHQASLCLCTAKACMLYCEEDYGAAAQAAAALQFALEGPELEPAAASSTGSEPTGGDSDFQAGLQRSFSAGREVMLRCYVRTRAAALDRLVGLAFSPSDAAWQSAAEPTEVRSGGALDRLVLLIVLMDAEVRTMVHGRLPTQRNTLLSNAAVVSVLREVRIETMAERMFRPKFELLELPAGVALSFDTIVEAALRRSVQGLRELGRLSTLRSAPALRQWQADVTFLAAVLEEFGMDPAVLGPTVLELIQQLADRTHPYGGDQADTLVADPDDPIRAVALLPPGRLEALVGAKLATQR